MFFKLFRAFTTGRTIYSKVLKPIYEELRKDAYATEEKPITKRKSKTNADDKKLKRSNRGKKNPQ